MSDNSKEMKYFKEHEVTPLITRTHQEQYLVTVIGGRQLGWLFYDYDKMINHVVKKGVSSCTITKTQTITSTMTIKKKES